MFRFFSLHDAKYFCNQHNFNSIIINMAGSKAYRADVIVQSFLTKIQWDEVLSLRPFAAQGGLLRDASPLKQQ